ncbi:Cell wall hydrolase CwlJ, involved in spore germination [Novosphingobium sp. CF614]|uniref:cell wall hydrolase n=1 Tax=Novosphingobium sp. CF614 TaxID=1884364 RepID=UPI0008F06566|nr:cell wall hydrolase [Novosphingobium sp. CF614]SFF86964.1 Cell wall hydrolase CwlJ, involved in spore germination [Novosphingobium sp. CF614]
MFVPKPLDPQCHEARSAGRRAAGLLALPLFAAALSVPGNPAGHADRIRRAANAPAASDVAPPPGLSPMDLIEIPRDDARRLNAAVPFSRAPNPAAPPFHFAGDDTSRLRAIDCLASAGYYEAGGDLEGQRAVAQVVLNRMRHPAFPSTICGVVYQGSERVTGCQFTFTCDGAMARRPVPRLWERAREIAKAALDGSVYAPVGLSTHYHTDWVMPVWSGSLDKVASVRTHLFFRWRGSWGRPGAFTKPVSATEPVEHKLAALSPWHRSGEGGTAFPRLAIEPVIDDGASGPDPVSALAGIDLRGSLLRLAHPQGDAFGFLVPRAYPGSLGLLALDVCRGRAFCKVMAWTDPEAIPQGFPIPFEARRNMAFLYVHDSARHGAIIAWNCDIFPREDPSECLSTQLSQWDAMRQAASTAPHGPTM